jgi:hypothetical protein
MATKKIEKLTPEQEAAMPKYVEKWMKIGLNTDPVDMPKAIEAVKLAYKNAGLKEPTKFYHAKSPLDAVRVIQELDPSQTKQDIFNSMLYGAHSASWLSFYDFFYTECGVEEAGKLLGLIELAKHSGWFNAYEDVVVFQDRPEVIKLDENDRLHAEFGPAVAYRDGYKIYSWHGVTIPAEWIEEKDKLSAKTALTWTNMEQRRAACEILGWAKILKDLKAKVINEDADPQIGTLVEVELPELGREKFLKVLCGTGREFAIPVPPEMKTALQANAWTYDIPADVMKMLEVRT